MNKNLDLTKCQLNEVINAHKKWSLEIESL